MNRILGLRMSLFIRVGLFAVLSTSWCTGITFFVLNRWFVVEGDFGPEKHPWQFNVLKIHGAAAFLMMIVFGCLLAAHVPAGWRTKRLRVQGITLVSAQGFLIVSAYLLYYIGGEEFRTLVGYAHASVGFVFPFLLIWHLMSGRFRRRPKGTRFNTTSSGLA